MRESLTVTIKKVQFNNSARHISNARSMMIEESEKRNFKGYQSNEYFAYLLLVEEKTEEEFTEYLNSLDDKEYIKLIEFPMNRIVDLGKLMTAST